MLEGGWYHHSMSQEGNDGVPEEDDDDDEDEVASHSETVPVDYKEQYKRLKRKLKFLIYENECYQENLRTSRAKLLEIARDRSFLLDRLLQYEKVDISSSSESCEDTESSDGEGEIPKQDVKRKKVEGSSHHAHPTHPHTVPTPGASKNPTPAKKKKPSVKASAKQNVSSTTHGVNMLPSSSSSFSASLASDGHMTPEEVERHLISRGHSFMELLPERAPPTVPTEMFSNDPSLDSESNEIGELETSPSNLGEDCLDMMGD